ncbi:unnamed protein product, partial [Coccothraustes coccothraustes]
LPEPCRCWVRSCLVASLRSIRSLRRLGLAIAGWRRVPAVLPARCHCPLSPPCSVSGLGRRCQQ